MHARTTQQRLVLTLALLMLITWLPRVSSQPVAAQARQAAGTCANAITRETWKMVITYDLQDSVAEGAITADVEHHAAVQVVFDTRQDFVDSIEWELTSMTGDLSLNDHAELHDEFPWWTETVGQGEPSYFAGRLTLDPVACTYGMWVYGEVMGNTNNDNGTAEWPQLTVLDFTIYNHPVGEAPEFFEAEAIPLFLETPGGDQDFTLPFDNHSTNETYGWYHYIKENIGDPIMAYAQVSWTVGGISQPPTVSDVVFEQQSVSNPNQWISVPSAGTYDGNLVQIKATLHNPLSSNIAVEARFLDSATDQLLPDGSQQLILPPQSTTTTTLLWDTSDKAWQPGGSPSAPAPHAPYRIKVQLRAGNTIYSQQTRQLSVQPRPVILVHGLNSNPETWASYPSFLAGLSAQWKSFAIDTLRTGNSPWPQQYSYTLKENAYLLFKYIEQVRKQENAWQVDIVAHSMGGLISRQYIHTLMPLARMDSETPVVRNLVMLGTPNQGSACATALYLHNYLEDIPNLNAPRDLMPSSVATFNQRVTNARGVHFSVNYGNLIPFPCSPLPSQLSDGVVTTQSARHSYTDVQSTSSHHLAMTSSDSDFSSWVVPHLTAPVATQKPQPQALSAPAVSAALSDTIQISQLLTDTIAGNSSTTFSFSLDGVAGASLQLVAPPQVAASLLAPSGEQVSTQDAYSLDAQLPVRAFAVSAPEAGIWTLQLENIDAEATPVSLLIVTAGDALLVQPIIGTPEQSRPLSVVVQLADSGTPVLGATVIGELVQPNGQKTSLEFHDDGTAGDSVANDGSYSVLIAPTLATGGTIVAHIQTSQAQRLLVVSLPDINFSVQLPFIRR